MNLYPPGKFLRNYMLQVQTTQSAVSDSDPVFVTLQGTSTQPCPYTCEFSVVRNVSNSAHAEIRIYNLGAAKRRLILRDILLSGTFQQVIFHAGYGLNALPLIFSGYVTYCSSGREGVNVVTTIECTGFDYQAAYFNQAAGAGVSTQQYIGQVLASLGPEVAVGAIGTFPGTPPTSQPNNAPTVEVLNDLTRGGFFIDNNKAYCLNESECLANPDLPLVSAGNGLLGSPDRRQTEVTLNLIFEPRIRVAQQLQIQSSVNSFLNTATYKVFQIAHHGTISPAVCGEVVTAVSLRSPPNQVLVQSN